MSYRQGPLLIGEAGKANLESEKEQPGVLASSPFLPIAYIFKVFRCEADRLRLENLA
jgi:hypothetical protein